MNAAGWIKRQETSSRNGSKVKIYTRPKPVGEFKTEKTVGVVKGEEEEW